MGLQVPFASYLLVFLFSFLFSVSIINLLLKTESLDNAILEH